MIPGLTALNYAADLSLVIFAKRFRRLCKKLLRVLAILRRDFRCPI